MSNPFGRIKTHPSSKEMAYPLSSIVETERKFILSLEHTTHLPPPESLLTPAGT
jgi:hypothetical protein